jgi:hypothetical protein
MAEYQSGAGVTRRSTVGSFWQAMSGQPLSADLLDWPPDLFALTSLMLQRSGAYRFALSLPPGRQWPPGSRSSWSTTVEAAGRAWSGVVDTPGEPLPPPLVQHGGGPGRRSGDAAGRALYRRRLGTVRGPVDAARNGR